MWLAPTAVWCRTWLTASPPWRRWGVVYSETACHHLRGGDFGGVLSLRACRRRPGRRNTRFRTAATAYRGGGNVRLRSSSPPSAEIALCGALVIVIVSAVGGGACAALRRGIISFIGPMGHFEAYGDRCWLQGVYFWHTFSLYIALTRHNCVVPGYDRARHAVAF